MLDLTDLPFNSQSFKAFSIRCSSKLSIKNSVGFNNIIYKESSTKRTVIFCASVKHADQLAEMIRDRGVNAATVSGSMKSSERKEFLVKFQNGEIMPVRDWGLA